VKQVFAALWTTGTVTTESEFPTPGIVDSRRLLGPNLYSQRAGVVLEVAYDDMSGESRVDAWRAQVKAISRELGWGEVDPLVRRERSGATLFFAAPLDVLMTATEVNEQAWALAEVGMDMSPRDMVVARLRDMADAERRTRPNLAAVFAEALVRNLSATFDDDLLTIGSGAVSLNWPLASVPDVNDIPWSTVRDIPIALVTGSNGKTTTTRLVAAMWRAAGVTPGWSCSDGVWAGDEQLESGDFSGPGGARTVLRAPGIGAAVLETARGGILRRGLAVNRADAAIITNVSADHFGEYGMSSVRDLAEVKAVVASVLGKDAQLVLNADDALLVELATRIAATPIWFSMTPEHPILTERVRAGGDAATVRDDRVMLHRDGVWHDLGDVNAMPITLRGAAPHNTQNLLGAVLLATALRIPVAAIRETLARFGDSTLDNPGRLQTYRFGGVTVLVDYAHNPDGLAALCETARAIPAERRLLLLGQAGNRDDEQIRALARAAWDVMPFERVIVKEELALLRGRAAGDVPGILLDELARLGVPSDRVELASSELAAMRRAFEWAREGDLLICPIHVDKETVLAWLGRLNEAGWRAGAPLPE
jgi:UDP-N-acetylmuramyl tripeptide synthase